MSEVRTPTFGAIIIGDEILSGKRTDKHFTWLAGVMAQRGLRLSCSKMVLILHPQPRSNNHVVPN